MGVGRYRWIALATLGAIIAARPLAAAPPWNKLMVFKHLEADPDKLYAIDENNGPWMILAATFTGQGAEDQARRLSPIFLSNPCGGVVPESAWRPDRNRSAITCPLNCLAVAFIVVPITRRSGAVDLAQSLANPFWTEKVFARFAFGDPGSKKLLRFWPKKYFLAVNGF